MKHKLKGWFKLAVVTTPIACILAAGFAPTVEFNDYYLEGWFVYGMANFIFWMLVGGFVQYVIPWVPGIKELRGGTQLGTNLQAFSKQSYELAKPLFQKAWDQYKAAGKTMEEFVADVLNSPKVPKDIRPYLMRFGKDIGQGFQNDRSHTVMKTDIYTKIILTVIAFLLLVLCIQNFGIIGVSKVEIHSKGEPLRVEIFRDGKPVDIDRLARPARPARPLRGRRWED